MVTLNFFLQQQRIIIINMLFNMNIVGEYFPLKAPTLQNFTGQDPWAGNEWRGTERNVEQISSPIQRKMVSPELNLLII